ncbi:Uncharacterised protein [Mycobacteroides abscessus subsp. abscessus]|nr:Uncharacterised protein [Mycobacteroides abscessus subsp. abscessus]
MFTHSTISAVNVGVVAATWPTGCVISSTPNSSANTSATLVVNSCRIKFLILPKMVRPARTLRSMVVNLSSSKIRSAASLVTSVPLMPMAMPMSAARKAGASLMPSPVMATVSPCRCKARTMRCLCSGDTRAYTRMLGASRNKSSSVMASSCLPSTTRALGSVTMPSFKAIARAVTA